MERLQRPCEVLAKVLAGPRDSKAAARAASGTLLNMKAIDGRIALQRGAVGRAGTKKGDKYDKIISESTKCIGNLERVYNTCSRSRKLWEMKYGGKAGEVGKRRPDKRGFTKVPGYALGEVSLYGPGS